MAFGGAYSPNRFERVSTLVAAHIQTKQAAFDETQPLPPCVQQWSAERRTAQTQGLLDPGEQQVHPRYLQVYIDDFTGCALDDVVELPPQVTAEVAGIEIGASQGTAHAGFVQAQPLTRVYVHAQLAVCGLRDVGLSAAPSKVVVGDPLIALGLQLNRAAGVIDCPDGKRAAVRADIAEQREWAAQGQAQRARVERLVG